jgi:TetR/AcrR family transcriptional regulator, transcriptional repressor for nem operon
MVMAKPTGRAIRVELLETARALIQTDGIGEFSYGALADALGIKAPSIHHHFPRKDQLVAEVAALYRAEFADLVSKIEGKTVTDRIVRYAALYAATAKSGRNCLCGAIAAEWSSVGEDAQQEISLFFSEQVAWLRVQMKEAQSRGEIRTVGVDPLTFARSLFSHLQGSLVLARSDAAFVDTAATTRALLRLVSV